MRSAARTLRLPLLPSLALGTCLVAIAVPVAASAQAPGGAGATRAELPLKPTRKVNFTTSTGSWMSLDVSPDGKTIVFDLLGDLYTLPITGGKATRLTSGQSFDAMPRFSPDGKRVAFVSDRTGGDNVVLMTLDGKDTVQLTKGLTNLYLSPIFTPDGKYVIASKSGGLGGAAKPWIYHVDGGSGQALIQAPATNPAAAAQLAQLKIAGLAMGKDSRYLWFHSRTGDWQYNAILPQYQLGVYDRETGTPTLMSTRYGSAFRPVLSPDGKWLVYGSRHKDKTGLRLRDVNSGEERWLAYPVQRDDQESRASLDVLPGYAFTPDSKAIVTSYEGGFWRVPIAQGEQATKIPFEADVALDAGPEVRFAYKVDDAATFTAHQIRDLSPSPDGKRVAFTVLNKVYVQDLPSGTPTRMTDLGAEINEHFPVWSPDSRSIAFTTWNDTLGGHIYKVPAAKGAVQQLTRVAAFYRRPVWSPDGRRIVAERAAARDQQEAFGGFQQLLGAQFVWVPAAGGDVTVISPTAGRGYAHFTSDSSRIYAYSFQDGLVSFRWDGTDVKSLLKVAGPLPPGAGGIGDAGLRPPMNLSIDGQPGFARPGTFLGDHEDELENNPTPPPASWMKISPDGDRALAKVGADLYVVTIPQVGGNTPTVNVSSPENAAFPVRKLSEMGAEFPSWAQDGKSVHWALGNVRFAYDLVRAKQVDDSLKADARAKAAAKADSAKQQAAAKPDSAAKPAAPAVARADSAKAPAAKPDSTKKEKPGYKPTETKVAIAVPRDMPKASAVLRGGRVITMKGKEVIENADVVVTNNRIVAVGARGSVQVPADAQVIDVSGTTITPGFVDTHYHPQWLVPDVHSNQTWQYLTTLAYGTTTTRDPQTATTDVLTYEDKVESGAMVGPRIYSTGPGLFLGENIKDLDHAKSVMKRYATYFDTKTLKMYMSGNRQQRQWIIMAAKELGIMPTTEGGLDFKLDMTHMLDGYSGVEHSLPIAPLYNDIVEMMKGVQVTHSPTLIVSYGGPFGENYFYTFENPANDAKLKRFTPESELDAKVRRRGTNAGGSPGPGGWFMKDEYVFPKHAEFAKRVVEAGGRVGIGSHGQLQGLGYHWEMWAMASGGMSNHDVLRTATVMGAEGIGMGADLGTVEGGKLADLVIMDKNPLDDIRNTNTIRYVMKNGRLYDGNSLDEVYPAKKAMPTFAWQDMGPNSTFGVLQAGKPKSEKGGKEKK